MSIGLSFLGSCAAQTAPEVIIAPEFAEAIPSPRVRPIRRDDEDALAAMISRCSPETLYRRFLTPDPTPDQDESLLHRMTREGPGNAASVVAAGDRVVAVGSYHHRPGSNAAELALLVEDAYQRRGLGTSLVRHLADRARQEGIVEFTADVLVENPAPQAAIRHAGYEPEVVASSQGLSRIRVPLTAAGARLSAR